MSVEVNIPAEEIIELTLLKTDNQNPNRMSEKQKTALMDSLVKYGFIVPIITNEDYLIADGQQRYEAAKALGLKQVPIVRLPIKDVDRRILRQVLNKLKGTHDEDLDAQEFLRIVEAGEREALQKLIQLSDGQLEKALREANPPPDETGDVPEPRETDIKLGDVFTLGTHRLMCGDATKSEDVLRLMNGARADLLFTDPPYGMDKDFQNDNLKDMSKFHNSWMPNGQTDATLIWYDPKKLDQIIIPALKHRGRMCDYLHLYKPNDIAFPLHSWIRTSESMIIFGKPKFEDVHPFAHDTYVWNHTQKDKSFYHPTVKPIEIVRDVIQRINAPIILDLFGGSGTTLIACEQLGRVCYMMEIDPQYTQVIIDRWQQFTGKQAIKL